MGSESKLPRLSELLIEVEAEARQRQVFLRKVSGALLIAFGLACLVAVTALVFTTSVAFYPISLAALAGWTLSSGAVTLLSEPAIA